MSLEHSETTPEPASEHGDLDRASAALRDVERAAASAAGPVVRRSTLTVGAADDAAERDADRVADQVMRALADPTAGRALARGEGADDERRVQRSTAPATSTQRHDRAARVRRSAPIGLEGGELDAATSAEISRRRGGGAPLDDGVRRRMEHGFGTDLGGVRVHTGAAASALNESMQAQAFTVGNDIFLHGSSPSVDSSSGERLLAHEIAHTLQQPGAAARQVRRKMMTTKAFNAATSEGMFTGSSKAQTTIRLLLDAYHAAYPWESQIKMSAAEATVAIEKLEEIRRTAQLWIKDHEVDVNGTVKQDPKRRKRRAGMDQLILACEAEMRVMRDLAKYKETGGVAGVSHDLTGITISQESEAFTKVKQKYDGDAASGFRKLGFLIDGAVPLDGDKAEISMEITIPIPPGFITIEFGAEAERDGTHVEAGLTVGVSGGASVGNMAKLSAGIGCYLSSKAKTGADAAELMSYALFRRCRESMLVPREVTNGMWGGGRTGTYGWMKAEQWSLGVERRIFANDDDAEVTTGGYGKLAAEIEVSKDLASIGFEVKGTKGTTINKESIERAKGTAGAKNKTSWGGDVTDGGGMRGTTQGSLGTKNMGLETSASFSFGILSGGIEATFGWTQKKVTGSKPIYEFDTFEIGANLAGEMPMSKVAGDKIAALIPNFVGTINKIIRGSTQAAQQETAARTGGAIVEEVGSYAAALAELSSVTPETWSPFAADPATAGTSIGSKATIELSASFDFKPGAGDPKLVVELRLGKSSELTDAIDKAGDVIQVFKLDISRSSRLLKLAWDGTTWTPS